VLLRLHWPLLVVLGIGALVRLSVAVAYRPALFFSDSWAYVGMAFGPSHFAGDRPSGYPAALVVISAAGRSLSAVTALQHVAGLATGVVVYALLRRLEVSGWIATAATALVVLDAYAIVLEQTILAEAFFALALIVSAYLLIGRNRAPVALGASGLLLAAAATMRTAALFAVPVWLLYLVWQHRRPPALVLASCALVLPLLAYAAVYKHEVGKFGLTESDGWFLYGRVAGMADCAKFTPPPGTRGLCEPPGHRARPPIYYVWSGSSPANRRYGWPGAPGSSAPLRSFARAVIRDDPLAYGRLVTRDFARYFEPGAASPGTSDAAISLPARPRTRAPWMDQRARAAYFPDYAPAVHSPGALMRSYQAVVHPPRPLLGLLALATICALALTLVGAGRFAPRHRAEAFLLTGMGLAMLAGSTATSAFVVRYLVPTVPLIVAGGTVAAVDLAASLRSRRASD
jgi:hypothetical protein